MTGESEATERVKRAFEAFNRGEREALLEFFDPDIEVQDVAQAVEEPLRHGLSGVRRWFAAMDEVWEELRIEPEEYLEVDESRLIVVARVSGRGRGSGIEVDRSITTLYTMRDGRVVHVQAFDTKHEALAAAAG
jgi:ketosteroid isomerase-like protein